MLADPGAYTPYLHLQQSMDQQSSDPGVLPKYLANAIRSPFDYQGSPVMVSPERMWGQAMDIANNPLSEGFKMTAPFIQQPLEAFTNVQLSSGRNYAGMPRVPAKGLGGLIARNLPFSDLVDANGTMDQKTADAIKRWAVFSKFDTTLGANRDASNPESYVKQMERAVSQGSGVGVYVNTPERQRRTQIQAAKAAKKAGKPSTGTSTPLTLAEALKGYK
jgi:hypothetical protein